MSAQAWTPLIVFIELAIAATFIAYIMMIAGITSFFL